MFATLCMSEASFVINYAEHYVGEISRLMSNARNRGGVTFTCPRTRCAISMTHRKILGRDFYNVRVGGYKHDGSDLRDAVSVLQPALVTQ